MLNRDDFDYAVEQTEILRAPKRRIESFGATVFHFYVLSELMDSVNQVRVRDGEIRATRPEIVSPESYSKLLLDGFGEEGSAFAEFLQKNQENLSVLKYGFQIHQSNLKEDVVHEPLEAVSDRITADLEAEDEDMAAVIKGVDEAWEVSLLQFTMDLIRRSAGRNVTDYRDEGLL